MSPHAPLSDVSSDLTVEVGTSSFALHKFPLVSRSGRIRKLISEAKNSKVTRINLHGTPGGAEAFEIAAKFCYGINTELNPSNVAMLRCAAHYLEMTEEFAEKNLELRTEIYLKEAVIPNIVNSITVLHHCESLLPAAEEINLINRILTAVATTVCKEQLTSGLSKLDHSLPHKPAMAGVEPPKDWWGKSLAVLSLDFFQRALSAMKSKGLKQETVSKILINYAQSSLQGLMVRDMQSSKGGFSDADMLKQQKIVVETIVSLLPSQSRKSPVPMAFLSGLLKTATMVSAPTICRADLERRIGLQLDQAILEDVLIPAANAHGGCQSSLYDTDSVHPNIKDSERYRLCKTIDCQKLSQEACSHAAQNERLPIQMAVQVLYLEQIRLRNVINGGHDQFFFGSAMGQCAQRSGSGVGSGAISPRDNYASVRRENRELKLEVARMRIRLTDLEKDHVSMKQELVRANPANKLLRSFTKNLSKLSALFRMRVDVKPLSAKAASDARLLFQKRRRQAIW
ncbi:hypothetical protein BHE74_00026373 [Ensete ventricosum]|nr:hypothetical protein BHE74_00026373 [Ensete ventricosum]RZR81966.1 hypothetical protein BHM03_00008289 [Ensete ventricosum]